MSENAMVAPPLMVPPEVGAFAAEKGAAEYLPALAALVQRLFPTESITVSVVDDPELSYNRTVEFRVPVRGWTSEQYHRARDQWVKGLFDCCPAPLVHVYGLNLVMVE
jgi:hypothetical protein